MKVYTKTLKKRVSNLKSCIFEIQNIHPLIKTIYESRTIFKN